MKMIRNYICKCEEGYILPVGKRCISCGENGVKAGVKTAHIDRYSYIIEMYLNGIKRKDIMSTVGICKNTVQNAINWYRREGSVIHSL